MDGGALTPPAPLAIIIFGRDASLAVAAVYYRYASLPSPKTFARYWDFSLPSAEVHPTTVSKGNTFLQLALIGLTLVFPVIAHYATIAKDSESNTAHQSLATAYPAAASARPLSVDGSAPGAHKSAADAGKKALQRVERQQHHPVAPSRGATSTRGDAQPCPSPQQRHANTSQTSSAPINQTQDVKIDNAGATSSATAAASLAQSVSDLPSLVISSVTALQVIVGATTVWSGFSYAVLKNAVTILGRDESLKKRQGALGRRIIGGSFAAVCVGAMAWAVFVDGWAKDDHGREE